jgi:hypothetical protein
MKKDFAQLIKDMRIALRPVFKNLTLNEALTSEQLDQALADIEKKQDQMVVDAGYTKEEFDSLYREYFMDFSSDKPEEWVIKHDPENAQIISGN